jgi:hypothetical protein
MALAKSPSRYQMGLFLAAAELLNSLQCRIDFSLIEAQYRFPIDNYIRRTEDIPFYQFIHGILIFGNVFFLETYLLFRKILFQTAAEYSAGLGVDGDIFHIPPFFIVWLIPNPFLIILPNFIP